MHDEHQLPGLRPSEAAGATAEQALAELAPERREHSRRVFRKRPRRLTSRIRLVMDELVGDYRRRLLILLGAVGLRPADRLRQHRQSPAGARRRRDPASWRFARRSAPAAAGIVRQLLTESLRAGGARGRRRPGARLVGRQRAGRRGPAGRAAARTGDDSIRWCSAFTALIVIASAFLFGLAPALRAARTDVHGVLKEGGRGAGAGGVRDRLRTSAHRRRAGPGAGAAGRRRAC